MAITAFKMGLQLDSALRSSLTRRLPKIVWSLMKKAEEYCKVEDDALRVKAGHKANKMAPFEIVQLINSVPSRSPKPRNRTKRDKKRDSRRSNDQCSQWANEQLQVDSRRIRRANKKYTELSEPISKVMSKVQHLPFFKWPPKMVGPPDMRRWDRQCEYHKDHGHDTDNCYALKDHLEELVQDGRLKKHVRKNNSTKIVTLRQDSPSLGVIHMIYSLPSTSAIHTIQLHPNPHKQNTPVKRSHEAAIITFDNSDLAGVTLPHIDPLVVELRVKRFTVERVLIDQGSTSEVMYYKTFIKLDFTESDLSPAHYPLFGFNANLEYSLGKITLPVRAGSRLVDVELLVVKLPSPYNLIMGRSWLHTMQAMPSTYHQLLRFLTERCIEQIRGSQKSAQVRYLLAAKMPRELEVNSIEVPDRESLDDVGRLPSEKATEALD